MVLGLIFKTCRVLEVIPSTLSHAKKHNGSMGQQILSNLINKKWMKELRVEAIQGK